MQKPIIDVTASCQNLKRLCREKGYSALDLQKELGLTSCQAVYKWFAGRNFPSLDNLVVLAYLLDVTIDAIIVTKFIEL